MKKDSISQLEKTGDIREKSVLLLSKEIWK